MISMKKVNYAAIDIGSNAVRLLIKCVNEENAPELMSKVQLIRIPLRLGEDAFTVGVISTEKEKKLIRLMKAYKQLMKIYDVVDYRACATSAMRDARNGKDIVQQIVKKTGIRVEIIDGQEEAHIVYDNHIEQLFASGQNYLYVDVGGGSTEINLISNGELIEQDTVSEVFSHPKTPLAQQFIQSTLHLDIPEDYLERLKTEPAADSVPMLRMEFTGQSVDAPLLSETARRFNVNNNIISAQMDYAGGVKFGIMLTEMHGTQEETQAAIAWLQEHHVKVEVLGYV